MTINWLLRLDDLQMNFCFFQAVTCIRFEPRNSETIAKVRHFRQLSFGTNWLPNDPNAQDCWCSGVGFPGHEGYDRLVMSQIWQLDIGWSIKKLNFDLHCLKKCGFCMVIGMSQITQSFMVECVQYSDYSFCYKTFLSSLQKLQLKGFMELFSKSF